MRNLPILLKPIAKDYLWGGSRLNDDFNLNIDSIPFAEAWVCSTHPDGLSYVPSLGCSLAEVLESHREWLGTNPIETMGGYEGLPIIVKLIDAKNDLSVQVHPNDEYAFHNENGSLGKSEMWYVLDAKDNTEIIYGFNRDVDNIKLQKALSEGSLERYLNHVRIYKDDLFFIEAGTVHALGSGALVVEIQESSNITYRMYDYDRKDKYGNKRPLHIEKAMEVVNMKSSATPRQPMRVLKYRAGCASELLARCKYFQVERLILNTEVHRELVSYKTNSISFHTLLCISGCGSIIGEDDSFSMNIFKGDCVFVPANSITLKLHGKAQILDISC